MKKMDLVDAVEYAKQEGSKNPYWTWDQSRRDEFKNYRAALRAQEHEQQHAIHAEGETRTEMSKMVLTIYSQSVLRRLLLMMTLLLPRKKTMMTQ